MVQRRMNVGTPPFTPASYTLLDYVTWVDESDPHWQNGITYEVFCGDVATTFDYCAVTGSPTLPNPTKEATGAKSFRGATPFTVYSRIDCNPVGFWDDAEKNVRDQLARAESREVEQTFWTGEIADGAGTVYPHLAEDTAIVNTEFSRQITLQPAATITVTGALGVVTALSVLEQNIAECYGAVGYIHVTLATFNRMIAEHLVTLVNGRYKTYKGNFVIPGNGYPGTSPAAAAPPAGSSWMYATGNVFGYRTAPKRVGSNVESFDRDENTLEMIVERTYLLAWDCCLFAVLTNNTGE